MQWKKDQKIVADALFQRDEKLVTSWQLLRATFERDLGHHHTKYLGENIPIINGQFLPSPGDVYGRWEDGVVDVVTEVTLEDGYMDMGINSTPYLEIYEIRFFRLWLDESWQPDLVSPQTVRIAVDIP